MSTDGSALAYADDIARNCAPSSLAVMKRQLYADAGLPIVEGITAFFVKRPPNFPALVAHD